MKIARTRNCPITKGNVHRVPLTALLGVLGVHRERRAWLKGIGLVRNLPPEKQWDLYERAKTNWRRMIWKAHPDRGGCHERAAFLNAVWSRIKILFSRLGISEG